MNRRKPCPALRGGQEAARTFPWVQMPCRDWYANTHVTYMHTACPKGLSEAGIPRPVPGIFRVFTVWKRHSQEDEREEETNPPKQTYPPTVPGSRPGQGKGLTAATTPWEDPSGLMPRRLIQGNGHQWASSHSGLGQHCVARYRGAIVPQLFAEPPGSCLPVAGQHPSAGFSCIFSTSPRY